MHKWEPAINTSHYYALLIVGLFPALIWSSTTFTPDTTGLYERPGDVKFTVEYYQKFVEKGNVELAKVVIDFDIFFLLRSHQLGKFLSHMNNRSNSI